MSKMWCSSALAVVITLLIDTLDVNLCGATDNRIVGGRPASEGEFPYQVSLRRSFNDKHFCGGALITAQHVLTAAHCMYYQWGGILPPIVVSVVAGQLNITMKENTEFRNASQIIIHPSFNKTSMENDVAIIKLSRSFPINHFISVVTLAQNDTRHKECIVSGWGVEEFESTTISESLLATVINRISNELCDEMYGIGTIRESMMCAHDETGEHDACQGDSGGPLVCAGQLQGVISTGEGCADKRFPGIYANVTYFYEWIMHNVDLSSVTQFTTESPETTDTESSTEETISFGSTTEMESTNAKTVRMNTLGANESTTISTTTEYNGNRTDHPHGDSKGLNIGNNSRIPDDFNTNCGFTIKISHFITLFFSSCHILLLVL